MKPRNRYRGLTLFVTVGSTRFDDLIQKVLSTESADQLASLGFHRLILQTGRSDYDSKLVESIKQAHNMDIEIYDYKKSISDDIDRSDVVMGHAGAGTCLEVLRKNKRLLVVVNDKLMDNHQTELADQLAGDNYVVKTTVDKFSDGLNSICNSELKLNKFPSKDSTKFEEVFNEALKKVTSRL